MRIGSAVVAAVFLAAWHAAGAQAIPAETAAALQRLGSRAGVIFAGQVVSVEPHYTAGYVEIMFHVEHSGRGCDGSGTYLLREWSGLWSGAPRYVSGQRLLMVLTSPGPSGLGAPVGGMAGRIPLVGTRRPPLLAAGGAGATEAAPAQDAADQAEQAVDLRWVQAIEVPRTSPDGPVEAKPLQPVGPPPQHAVRRAISTEPYQPRGEKWRVASPGPSLSAVLELLQETHAR